MKSRILIAMMTASVVAACGGGGNAATPPSSAPAQTTPIVAHGTITGFGSVIVEGVHYDISRADIRIDGTGGRGQDDLSAGQRVTIRGTVDDHGVHAANEVEYEAELHATVTAIDVAGNSFQALGQTVRVDDATIYRNLTDLTALVVGDAIEVSGSRTADGSLLASFVEREGAQADAEVKGSITAADTTNRRFTIGSQLIDYSTATLSPSSSIIANGVIVEVAGSLRAGVLVATRVRQDNDDLGGAASGSEVEFEGLIRNLADDRSSFNIDSTLIRVTSATTYENGTAATLATGVKVEAEGTTQTDGSLLARKIEFRGGGSSGAGNGGGNGGGNSSGEIDGVVTAIDRTANTVTVLGSVIRVADSTVFRDQRDNSRTFTLAALVVGDYVEAAFSEAGPVLTATRLERERTDTRSSVKAALDSFNQTASSLVIAGVTVDATSARYQINETSVTAAQFYAAVTVGSTVRGRGSFSSTRLAATDVELDQDD